MPQPTYFPEWDTTKTLATRPPLSYREEGWTAPGGVGEKPPLDYFNWWQNNVFDWIVWLDEEKDRIDEKYLPDNVEKLLLNDASATPGDAYIGRDYGGSQFYGRDAVGAQFYGNKAVGSQRYGQEASGAILFARDATGSIEIGSTAGSAATKKLISGAKEATFEEIIDGSKWGTWQTPVYNSDWEDYTDGGIYSPLRYRVSGDGKQVQLRGGCTTPAGSGTAIFNFPAGYRPAGVLAIIMSQINGTSPYVYRATLLSTGNLSFTTPAGGILIFNNIFPTD